MRRLAVSILALFLIAAVPALAQEEPPARVGRVSFVSGQLTFHAAGETEWSAAAVNYPVATGGSFATDAQSRAEIRIGAQTISLSNDTQVDVTRLNQRVMQITVPQGRIEAHLRALPQGNTVEIDIPRGAYGCCSPASTTSPPEPRTSRRASRFSRAVPTLSAARSISASRPTTRR